MKARLNLNSKKKNARTRFTTKQTPRKFQMNTLRKEHNFQVLNGLSISTDRRFINSLTNTESMFLD